MKRILFVIFALANIMAFGQEQKDTATYVLKEVNIISTYRPTAKSPVTETVVGKTAIKETSNIQEVPVFLNNTPSMTSYSDGGHENGYTYMRLRGIDQTRINFTLNGTPMNEPEDQGFYSSNFPDFLSSMNSVAIMRGVGTTTYGMSSYVGSINFESANICDSAYQLFTGTYGSYNTSKISAEINTGLIHNKLGFYSRASMTSSDGYRNNSGNNGYSYFLSGGYIGNKHIIKINSFVGTSANRQAWLGASKHEIDSLGYRFNPNSATEWDYFTQSFIQIHDYYRINNKSSLTSSIFYNRLTGNWDLDLKNTFGDPSGFTLNYQLWSNFTGGMVNYRYILDKFRFDAGINANYYERTHAAADKINDVDLFYKNKGVKNSGSVFVKGEYDLGKLTFFGDIQYRLVKFSYVADKIDPTSAGMAAKTWNFISPKVGLTYYITKNVKTYIAIGKTRREPTRTDMFGGQDNLYYTDSTHTNTTYIVVKPEQVTDYEAGIKTIYKNIRGSFNLFYMDFKDEITLKGALGANGLPLMTNVSNSFRSGAELDLSIKVKNFTFINSSSYMYCQIKTDSGNFTPVMTPKLIINQGVLYTYKKLTLGLNGRYLTKRYLDLENLNTLDNSFGLDASLMYKFRKNDISINAYNVLGTSKNASYSNGYIGPDGLPRYFVDCPVNIYVTLHIKL